jgi:hypothetical protein
MLVAVSMPGHGVGYIVKLNYSQPHYNQKTLTIYDLSDRATIGELKSLVHQKTGILPATMAIFLQGDLVLDAQNLQEIAQHEDAVIDIWIDEGGFLCALW